MTLPEPPDSPGKSNLAALWILLFGNFIIGTGILLPAALLNDLSAEYGISAATAGLMGFVGGLVVAVGAPLFAGLTSAIDRRLLLTAALAIYAVGHLGAAVAPGFDMQLVLRAITVVGAAIFTPQAAATAGLLVPLNRRPAAIAFIFIGWSAASVAGIPLGGLLSSWFGWRVVFAGMGAISALAALAVWLVLERGLFVQRLNLAAWKQALGTPALLMVFAVTLLSMSGQFTMFSYIAPILRDGFAASPTNISAMFAFVGVAGVAGNAIASRLVRSAAVETVINAALAALALGFCVFALGYGHYTWAIVGGLLWGLGSFSSNSLQQSRLVTLAPPLAAATVALNTSVVYLGQSTGAVVGGWMINKNAMAHVPWLSVVFLLAALGFSIAATRVAKP